MKERYQNHLNKVLSTIKFIDIEERYDIYFSRFYGLYFANAAKRYKLTPTHISLVSLVIGVFGGLLFYYQNQISFIVVGGLLVTLAGVLDSADGQLARMTGQSSNIGRIIDGCIDFLVFIACYIGGTLYLVPIYGFPVVILTFLAILVHSYKAMIYDFYKAEYLYLVNNYREILLPLSSEELKSRGDTWYDKFFYKIENNLSLNQIKYTTRTSEERKIMRELSMSKPKEFNTLYKKYNYKMLFWWASLGGSNLYRNALIIFVLFARFDLFLICSIISIIGYIPLNLMQKYYDKKLMRELKILKLSL